jgi:hypothetical protein
VFVKSLSNLEPHCMVMLLEMYSQHFIFFVANEYKELARVFVPGKFFV